MMNPHNTSTPDLSRVPPTSTPPLPPMGQPQRFRMPLPPPFQPPCAQAFHPVGDQYCVGGLTMNIPPYMQPYGGPYYPPKYPPAPRPYPPQFNPSQLHGWPYPYRPMGQLPPPVPNLVCVHPGNSSVEAVHTPVHTFATATGAGEGVAMALSIERKYPNKRISKGGKCSPWFWEA